MADLKLKDKQGVEQTYSGVNRVLVPKADGSGYEEYGNGGGGGAMIPPMAYQNSTITSFTDMSATGVLDNAFAFCLSLTSVSFPVASYIGAYAFIHCPSLTTVSFPVTSYIGSCAFDYCPSLTSVSFPVASYIGASAFYNCSSLTTASLPMASYIGSSAFNSCSSLTTASFPMASLIGAYAFNSCRNLVSLYLMSASICSLAASTAFNSTPIAGYTASTGGVYGSIYVPASLLASYKAATNWTYFSSRMVGI